MSDVFGSNIVLKWERTDSSENLLEIIQNFFANLTQEPIYVIVEKNSYWHYKKILNYVFFDINEAKNICKSLNNSKNRFNGWDWDYHFNKKNKPKKSWDEAREEMGCRYDGGHYGDIDYVVCHLYHKYKISPYTYKTYEINRGRRCCPMNVYHLYNVKNEIDKYYEHENLCKYRYLEISQTFLIKQQTCYKEEIEDNEFSKCFDNLDNRFIENKSTLKEITPLLLMGREDINSYFYNFPLDLMKIIYANIKRYYDKLYYEQYIKDNFVTYVNRP